MKITHARLQLTASKLRKYDLYFKFWHAQFYSNHVWNLKVLWFWLSLYYFKPYEGS